MKTFFLQVLGLFIVIVVGLLISTNSGSSNPVLNFFNSQTSNTSNVLAITDSNGQQKTSIKIEIVQTPEAKAKGLGGRDSLASDAGMLFVYDKADRYKFWMKGMKIPIDFIWIKGNSVVDLLPNISPPDQSVSDSNLPLYSSITDADKILEVRAGFIAEHNITMGDQIEY